MEIMLEGKGKTWGEAQQMIKDRKNEYSLLRTKQQQSILLYREMVFIIYTNAQHRVQDIPVTRNLFRKRIV